MSDEFQPKLLNVMDDDEGNFIVLLRQRLLSAKEEIKLQVVAVGAPSGEVEMHAGLDPTGLGLIVVHGWPPRRG